MIAKFSAYLFVELVKFSEDSIDKVGDRAILFFRIFRKLSLRPPYPE
jgi:hypothetical protein